MLHDKNLQITENDSRVWSLTFIYVGYFLNFSLKWRKEKGQFSLWRCQKTGRTPTHLAWNCRNTTVARSGEDHHNHHFFSFLKTVGMCPWPPLPHQNCAGLVSFPWTGPVPVAPRQDKDRENHLQAWCLVGKDLTGTAFSISTSSAVLLYISGAARFKRERFSNPLHRQRHKKRFHMLGMSFRRQTPWYHWERATGKMC